MTNLCVTFEEWYLGDGTYPPLHRGEKVNLSFYISATDLNLTDNNSSYLKQIRDSDYSFSAQIIRNYENGDRQLVILDTGELKFYIEVPKRNLPLTVGQFVCGTGQILIDYYAWVENLDSYDNPPDLFYSFSVEKIRKVKIPEKFINRNDKAMSYPSSLAISEYSIDDTIEIEDMRNDTENTCFYLLDLKAINESIPKTFC
jgi:hypothetical protein